jgi:hypothetical protein
MKFLAKLAFYAFIGWLFINIPFAMADFAGLPVPRWVLWTDSVLMVLVIWYFIVLPRLKR